MLRPRSAILFLSTARKISIQLEVLPRALSLIFAAAPRWTAASGLLLAAQGLLPLAGVWLTRPLVDGLAHAVRSGANWQAFRPVIILAALMAAAAVLAEVLRALTAWVRTNQSELVQDHVMALVHRKSMEVDMAFYDSPEFFNKLHRARAEAAYRPAALLDAVGSVLQNGLTLAAMFAVLVSFGPWVPIALVLSTLPALWVVLRYAMRQHELRLRTTSDERRTWYFDWLLTAREAASEQRLFGLGSYTEAAYQLVRSRLRAQSTALARGNAISELSAGMLALVASGASMAWMLWGTLSGAVSLGGLAMFYQAFQQGLRLMRSLLDNTGQLYYNSLFLGNLFEFLALESSLVDPSSPARFPAVLRGGIRFSGVTFRYPGAEHPVLNNFSLEVPAGRFVAFVGPNGAGKSTFIKLLCRFYDPDEGSLEIDGIDLRKFSQAELRSRITVLFQEPVRYNASAAENISLGDICVNPGEESIRTAAESAGAAAVIAALPHGYENLLGKTFLDGEELSAGQWQRIALARAFYRAAPILILDEPTSAMDPWAEANWLKRFRSLAAGRTSILITHRLTTAMQADVIHLISDGRVIESGSHLELLAAGGLYAQAWREQTSFQGVANAK